jgi:hypothetical protein
MRLDKYEGLVDGIVRCVLKGVAAEFLRLLQHFRDLRR